MSAAPKRIRSKSALPGATQCAADLRELLGHVSASWDNERRSLSRQLHDSMGSTLTALSMHLSILEQQLPAASALLERIALMKQLLLHLIESNRQMQLKLWSDKFEFLGLKIALNDLAWQFAEQHHLTMHCTLPPGELSCPHQYGALLLHVLEEALRNIASHAQASEVEIDLAETEAALTLTVKDNGIGLAHAAKDKHGLRLLRERIRHLGGTLSVTTVCGTTLRACLPKSCAMR